MILTDTHTHLYLDAFDADRHAVINRAVEEGVQYLLLPNIDSGTTTTLLDLCFSFPDHCFPMIGLHPTSVKDNYTEELEHVRQMLRIHRFYALGETGMDFYWDTTFKEQQDKAFRAQIGLALEYNLPIVIHSRDSFDAIADVLDDFRDSGLTGVFHCFTGTSEQAEKALKLGFYLGIGGVLTFKNSNLGEVIKNIPLEHLVLETDSPFLAPVPFRGKRNESSYTRLVANRLAEIKNIPVEEVADRTTENAKKLFKFDSHA
jgi:TatD DNase family protein